ncbi:DENN domain and WD repeat-containing protein SCD1 isoform X2 [Cynara cardunculus var. scolymus]|uniref:DENN domain and WD repeat-containing protein SCD1 isoform X2 n=1 Tax=Cynara cardunculus var. scolymus TaxID=59895 RepID=UPI000D62F51A|nr:DENN domain and WD repeat-containing protein SCD1 isoform X2 [Cynara cardunculus var. scolymus]
MSQLFEYFVVCGIGPEIRTLDGEKGFHGTGVFYLASLLDQYPPPTHMLYPPPPPQLPTCVLPAGVEFYTSGFDSRNALSFPRSYPIVLTDLQIYSIQCIMLSTPKMTEGDGSKIYVSCIAFRDPVCEDIAEAYHIPANSFADKCICLVSRAPSFHILREVLEEIYLLCFSSNGSSKPLWDAIAYTVSKVPLPTPGKERVLFAIENSLLSVDFPPKDGLPHADISFQPLVQCLDVDNFIKLFTAVLIERRVLLRSNKYSLLTLASEAICHLIYPFRWQHVYIPLLFFSGVDYIDAPTPYMMGLHSGVDTTGLSMDGVVVVDLEHNCITTNEEIPPIPEPEMSSLRSDILKLLHPNVVWIDSLKSDLESYEQYARFNRKAWSPENDVQLRIIFLKFFASILGGYRNFIENTANQVFNTQAFLKKRSRATHQPIDEMVTQFLESQGFLDYLERGIGSSENGSNLLDKLQDAIGRGQDPLSILPSASAEPEIITISDPGLGISGSGTRYTYDRFPSNYRSEEQEEKRKQILSAASGALEYAIKHNPSSPSMLDGESKGESLSPRERAAERERMVLDIKVKLQGLWLRLLKLGATDDPLSSFEYGTILALIEIDAEGIGGSGFVECIREHIHSGWQGQLTEEQFIAVKELLKTAITRATSRNDIATIRDALEVSAEMYKKDRNHVSDFVQRHLRSLSIWEELRFWDVYFEYLMECFSNKSTNYAALVTAQLIILATHMAGLGLPDTDSWYIIETIAGKNNIGYSHIIKLRGYMSHIQQLCIGYWGIYSVKSQSISSLSLPSPRPQDVTTDNQQPAEASGRSWVQSMFSRDTTLRTNSFTRVPKSESGATGQHKLQSSIRTLRGHNGAITALHCVTQREVWDLVGDREDAGFFISGSTDCTVKIWDPSLRGNELRATLKGHTRTVRAISSDRGKIVSGSDDHYVFVWDKQTTQLLEELKGHDAEVSCARMLSGERVLTAAYDGTVKMWDVRTDTCVATVGRCSSAVLCMEYDDSTGVLAAAGRDAVANIWDIRSGRQMHKLLGHSKWIRSIRMVGDTVITGSDDWTARMWSISRGTCDAVLACHAGPVLCVEYSKSDRGVITGSSDGLVRFWENEDGGLKSSKNVTIHTGAVLSINAGENWLGIGAADNTMSLFHRPQERLGGFSGTVSKISSWQLYRTPQKAVAMVRCVASDLERKRICSGGRNGLLRLWDATINI